MNYDFEHGLEQHNSGYVKWDRSCTVFESKDVLPMWGQAWSSRYQEPVTEALMRCAQHERHSRSSASPSVLDAIVQRLWCNHQWKVDLEWLLFTPGGEGFARMNIACPRSAVQEGLTRIANALRTLEQR